MNTALLFSLKGYIEGVHQGWSLTSVSPGVRCYFQAYIIVVKIQFLARNKIEGLKCLTGGQLETTFASLPYGPFHKKVHDMAVCFFKASKESPRKMDIIALNYLLLYSLSLLPCSID